MSIKKENEITVRTTCTDDYLLECMKRSGFKEGRNFKLDDYYLIPNNIDISNTSIREIVKNAIIVRYIEDQLGVTQLITFKRKIINESDEIIKQETVNCNILSIEEAKKLFEAIGYYQIMNIKEKDVEYSKDDFSLTIKFILNGDTLIEVETDLLYDSIDKLKSKLDEFNLPIETDNYFVKKAEETLEKILKHR